MRPAIVVAAALLLAGCAAPEPEASATPDRPPTTMTVFVAASLNDPFDELEREFEEAYPGTDIIMNYGGSSGLAEQIVAGAPADVFAAASLSTMRTVTSAGLAASPADFATNTLELVVPAGNPGGVTGIADLARPELAVVLCAAEVPCGESAQNVFDVSGVVPSVDSYEQDVKAVLTKVRLGEADAGLVYVTDVIAGGDAVEGIEFEESAQAVNRYQIAAVSQNELAREFVDFVLSARGQEILTAAGFGAP